MATSRRVTATLFIVMLACWLGGSSASAQYFGRNKVQYKKFQFKILKTEHFDIYYYPEEQDGVELAARIAERWHARLEQLFDHQLRGRQPLVLYASHADFEQTNAIQGELSEGTGGVTEPLRRRIILPLAGPLADTDHVIGHELVHAFQFDLTSGPNTEPGRNGAERLPLWFIEGMAEYMSLGPVDPNTAMWLRDAARKEQLPSVKDLDNPKYFPYRWGQAFWAYVGGRWGDDVIRQLLDIAAKAGDPFVAIKQVLGVDEKQLSADWHTAIHDMYGPVLSATEPPSDVGQAVVKGKKSAGDLNVGPALSPDGRYIAYLSEQSLLSIDLFVADAASGKVLHKLTSTASDPHYSSIQFIYSAGAWDADSRRIAIATVTDGHAALAIFDAQSGERQREIAIAKVDEVLNPTWSPDGRSLCFSGMTRGLTDLFVVDVASGSVRQLTNDAFADVQPAWSPDGSRIAFATDRFSSTLATLDIGDYRIGFVDPRTGSISQAPAFTTGKNINPQWAPDGSAIYFIADRDGIPNVYRMTLPAGDITEVTTVGTGISGITNSSPALSVASRAGTAAVSVYDDGRYDIYTLPTGAGQPIDDRSDRHAGVLPPADRTPGLVQRALADPRTGLPEPQQFETNPYRSSLHLEALGQPTVAVGASRFGAALGGGISAYFSDMLGDHTLTTMVDVNSGIGGNFSLKNTAAEAIYLNQAHRWNWGMLGGQVPYLSAGALESVGDVNGEPSLVDQTVVYRQTERSVAGLAQYPFNRSRRIEFQGGFSQLSFDQILYTQAYSLNTGDLIYNHTDESRLADTLNMATTSAALVFDTSSSGPTSPVQGTRYRLEAAPTFGTVNYTSLVADYRRYFMPASFYTIAGRVLHYGRYGSGADDPRFFPLYLGYPNLVRGYDMYSIQPGECVPNATSQCPAFDRLVGNRVLVGNLEFRMPLLRPFTGAGQNMYGPLPVELALFLDGGVAWNSGEKPSVFGGHREGVSSAGATVRVNFFGYAVGQFDFVRPLQRPGQGWMFQFNLSPGF
jgi:Tol biopolymer transport system component